MSAIEGFCDVRTELAESQRQDGEVPLISSSGITGRHSEPKLSLRLMLGATLMWRWSHERRPRCGGLAGRERRGRIKNGIAAVVAGAR